MTASMNTNVNVHKIMRYMYKPLILNFTLLITVAGKKL